MVAISVHKLLVLPEIKKMEWV